jgi:AraC-like DNA-binding protein
LCRALQAIHHDAVRHWTIGELAQLSGMSRSSFSFHFARIVGIAPVHYLRNWRVALAKRALIDRRLPIEKVAQLVGYQSVSAFSTAFARAVGEAPTTFAERRSLPPTTGARSV